MRLLNDLLFMRKRYVMLPFLLALLLAGACGRGDKSKVEFARDAHSFAKPMEAKVTHLALDISVDFEKQQITGVARLTIENLTGTDSLVLDTKNLTINRVTLSETREETDFKLGEEDAVLGRPLMIHIKPETKQVAVEYHTNPGAAALQWLAPEQTAGKRYPFLFTQSQAILARTWVPCQDTPGNRITYSATVKVPPGLMAVMSAENSTERAPDGVYTFNMPQAIPTYLLALAVGDIDFRPIGARTGVYAEPSIVDSAAWEFADTEKMMEAAEELYGPYRWGRYDILVLPPSFPFGGMENPRLTFATPTILAGDRSLVSLVAHELAHSWSGNLVTNANWNDFWLNEGFTTYFEHRIMEAVYGKEYEQMLALLALQDLQKSIADMGAKAEDTHLHLDLAGRDPDEGMTDIAYEKGHFFLRMLEETLGRQAWDAFLREYFESHAFQSMTSKGFVAYLDEHLLRNRPETLESLHVNEWIFGPGLPDNCPQIKSTALDQVAQQVAAWNAGTAPGELQTEGWSTHHWLYFLRRLPQPLPIAKMLALDEVFHFTNTANSEILHAWLLHVIASKYTPAYPALHKFLTSQGRRKFLRPLYAKLAETEEGLALARKIYREARPTYHAISKNTIDGILGWQDE